MLLLKLKAINPEDHSNLYDVRINADEVSSYHGVRVTKDKNTISALQIKLKNGDSHIISETKVTDLDTILEGMAGILYGK